MQGNTRMDLRLSPSTPSGKLPGLTGELQGDIINNKIDYGFPSEFLVVDTNRAPSISDTGFIVPSFRFFPVGRVNVLAMQATDFAEGKGNTICSITLAAFSCFSSYGRTVFVGNPNNPYDQLSGFTPPSTFITECDFAPESTVYSNGGRLSFTCSNIGTTIMVLELSTEKGAFTLIKLFGEPYITDSGVLPFTSSDDTAVLYIDITNRGESQGTFSVQPVVCCTIVSNITGQEDCNVCILDC